MKRRLGFVILTILAAGIASAQGTRPPVFAGAFYDADPARLASQIDGYLKNAGDPPAGAKDARILICPHAGYIYSGQTAAYAYRVVQGKPLSTVVVVGTSHQYPLDGASIYLKGGFETPLGTVEVDGPLASRIARASGFSYVAAAHEKEHSVEVQVPFIQRAIPGAKIVPIVLGYPTRANVNALARGLGEALATPGVLIVVSTDLSHYLTKEKANVADAGTIDLVRKGDAGALADRCARGENVMCGGGGVAAALIALKKVGPPRVEVLHYADSSDVTGDTSGVVGYLAAAVSPAAPAAAFSLSPDERKELLRLARQAVRDFVADNRIVEYTTQDPNLLGPRGAFVTLKKHGELRGCIGYIEPVLPLYDAIIRVAIYAATQDQRFPPVTRAELEELDFEISVLTTPEKIDSPARVEVGRHGLVISQGENRGLLLPQVAVENGWNRETFLNQACIKAGLPPDAWKKGAEIATFEAIVFR
jgi:MEMO1 family protein